jgi:ubiquinone/menaquinone biosynthesis C-methylase UbiE
VNEPGYEYRGMLATTWDLFRGDTSLWEDRFFYLELIARSGQPVLDVGCGTGRLLLDYLAQGLDVDGVDNSPEMLALCRAKAQSLGLNPPLFEQWMEALDLPRRYRTILVPSSSFQLMIDPETATRAMERFYAHLEPGGALAMPFMLLWQPGEPTQQTEWTLTGEKTRPEDGAVVRRWSRSRYDVERQLEHTEDRYEAVLDGQVVAAEHHQRSPATRGYTQEQAVELYRAAGFSGIEVCSGFTRQPASQADPLFTVVGKRL